LYHTFARIGLAGFPEPLIEALAPISRAVLKATGGPLEGASAQPPAGTAKIALADVRPIVARVWANREIKATELPEL
jgi:hypothetical protein